jgi:hypothetical protein
MTTTTPHYGFPRLLAHFAITIILTGLACSDALAQTACTIIQPTLGQLVGREIQASGTARVVAGQHAWLVARRSDFSPHWWLQRKLHVNEVSPGWKSVAALGGPQDIGWDFDIAVVIVATDSNRRLQEHWDRGVETSDFKPIAIRETVAAPCTVTVRKSRH